MANSTKNNTKGININISNALSHTLDNLAVARGTSKTNILRKAIALFELVIKEREKGGKLIVVDEENNVRKEIIGF